MSRILIADDNANNLYLLKTVLRVYGYDVVSAINGAEALARARENPPDLIVSDILMPVMDGYELCRQWRADDRLRQVPFIFYTATYTGGKNAQLASNLGADRFVIKPQEPHVIVQIIRETLDKRISDLPMAAEAPHADAMEIQREYNEILFHKLEKKVADLEVEIVQHERAEKALCISEAKYRELVENANSIIMRHDAEGRITFFNEFALKFFGYRTGEILGQHIVGTIVPAIESNGKDLVRMIQDIGVHPDRYLCQESENIRRTGERVWIAWTNKAILDTEGRISEVLCIGNNITDWKKSEMALYASEAKLRALTSQLALAEDRERRRIATGLHDDVCQTLVVAKTHLGMMAPPHQDGSAAAADAHATVDRAIDRAITSLRTLMFDLSPPALHELGLEAAVNWFAERIQRLHDIPCHVHCHKPLAPMDEGLRTIVFLATRELMMNVVKHAKARTVSVTLDMDGGRLLVEVEDDGVGFDKNAVENAGQEGFGLFSIRERIKAFGGSLELFSQDSSGTTAIMSVPIEPDKARNTGDDPTLSHQPCKNHEHQNSSGR